MPSMTRRSAWLAPEERTDAEAQANGAYNVFSKTVYQGLGAAWLEEITAFVARVESILGREEEAFAELQEIFSVEVTEGAESNRRVN